MADRYREQVTLLLRILPSVAREEVFGLKGGTAINLFERNMPACRSTSTSPICHSMIEIPRSPTLRPR